MATFAPSAPRRFAIAAPMPRDPPVTSAIFPSSFLVIVFPIPSISLFPLLLTLTASLDVAVPRLQHTLLSWHRCLTSMGVKNGITTPSLFRRGRGGRKSDGGSRAEAAHVTTFLEPADSRS